MVQFEFLRNSNPCYSVNKINNCNDILIKNEDLWKNCKSFHYNKKDILIPWNSDLNTWKHLVGTKIQCLYSIIKNSKNSIMKRLIAKCIKGGKFKVYYEPQYFTHTFLIYLDNPLDEYITLEYAIELASTISEYTNQQLINGATDNTIEFNNV